MGILILKISSKQRMLNYTTKGGSMSAQTFGSVGKSKLV